jgi:hypothetical protein
MDEKVPNLLPFSIYDRLGHVRALLFWNILCLVLNDPGVLTHPIPEDTIHIIKSEPVRNT